MNQGLEPLLPTVRRLSQWKDRKKKIEVPLFSCYCFVRESELDWKAVWMVGGVVDIIGGVSQPEPIPDDEILAIKKLMTSILPYDAYPYLHEGMQVQVVRGPLQGIRGILFWKEKAYRLVVGIRLIQQTVSVVVNANDVVPV